MALIDVYNNSKTPTLKDAKTIPSEETDFFDRQHTFSDGFTTELKSGDPSQFKDKALNYFDTLEKNFVAPTNFVPLADAPGLDAWTSQNPYGQSGAPKQ